MIRIVLNIKNETKFVFSSREAEKTILNTLKSQNLQGIFEIELKLVSKPSIQKLNKEFRHKDYPTDVLSFPIQNEIKDNHPEIPVLLGDIVVCPAIIKKNAKEFHNTIDKEFLKMIDHSTLHLVGIHHEGD
ncbi:MAG: rRNA maturation RNase YbeY [Candidatus Berkelbacteria bacterium]